MQSKQIENIVVDEANRCTYIVLAPRVLSDGEIYSTAELAAAALNALHSYSLGGRYIVVTEARPPQEPKGLISAGFDFAPPSVTKRGGQRDKTRSRSSRFPRRGDRKR